MGTKTICTGDWSMGMGWQLRLRLAVPHPEPSSHPLSQHGMQASVPKPAAPATPPFSLPAVS